MLGVKKLDLYILKKFLPLFCGAFFICLFVFMMQFTWRYVDELIGKGLSLEVLGQFFWYMALTLIPMSLPLSVLLASLITFGNMGEQLELLSMKAAGVPLVRIMRPVLFFVILTSGASFFFLNKTAPDAQVSLRSLLLSMKQAQPAVEIPEGVFYNEVPNLNLYVERKQPETGMLYQVIIYKTDQGFDRAQIVLADSGRMEMSADKLHLKLELWQGEQFENLQQQNFSALNNASVPYDRETFDYKQFLIDFDSNFEMMDKDMLRDMASAKNMAQIVSSVDSVNLQLDSVGKAYLAQVKAQWVNKAQLPKADSARLQKAKIHTYDELLARTAPEQLQTARQAALSTIKSAMTDLEWKSTVAENGAKFIRRHWVEWHQKMTLSLGCIIFFFVGAPLGAIIRKGGLGLPAVISVLIFIFYYIVNTSGMKLARDGVWNMTMGMWMSSVVLIPFGVFLTYKSNKDSVVFNAELYASFFRRLLGLRSKRNLSRKEVIINDPHYAEMAVAVQALREGCNDYIGAAGLIKAPNYVRLFFKSTPDHQVEALGEQMEAIVEDLSNSREAKVFMLLNNLPVIFVYAHTTPFEKKWANYFAGVCLPLGLILWLRIWRFRLRLLRDMRQIVRTCDQLHPLCSLIAMGEGANVEIKADEDDEAPKIRLKSQNRRRILKIIILLAVLALVGWYSYRYFPQTSKPNPSKTEAKEVQPATPRPATDKAAQPQERREGHQKEAPTDKKTDIKALKKQLQ